MRRGWVVLVGAIGACLGLGAPALANCDLSVGDFGAAKVEVRRALTADDLQTAARVVADVESRYVCLTFAPARPSWAEWHLLVAVTRSALGQEADALNGLVYAMHLDPFLDRSWLGIQHPLRTSDVGRGYPTGGTLEVPRLSRRIRRRATLYVDGEPAASVPNDTAPHLLQLHDGVWWDSEFVTGTGGHLDWAADAGTERGPSVEVASRLWVPKAAPRSVDIWLDAGIFFMRADGRYVLTGPTSGTGYAAPFYQPDLSATAEVVLGERYTMWLRYVGTRSAVSIWDFDGRSVDVFMPTELQATAAVYRRPAAGRALSVGVGWAFDRVRETYDPLYSGLINARGQATNLFASPSLVARFVQGRERRLDAFLSVGPDFSSAGIGVRPTRGAVRYRVGAFGLQRGFGGRDVSTEASEDELQPVWVQRTWTVGLEFSLNVLDTRINDDIRTPRSRTGRSSRREPIR